jgi:putative SOS response-associated peptidase YedK
MMCGRIIQAAWPLRYNFVEGLDVSDTRLGNLPRRYNGAPGQDLLVIRENHNTGERALDPLRWGLIPHWTREARPKLRPINARAETIARSRLFAEAYARRRCIVPVDGFFEWAGRKGARQPYAIAMRDGSPFGLAGIWENWKHPETGEWLRTFAVITVPANALVAKIHDRMPAILRPKDYLRWLGPEFDPRDLLITYPDAPMRMWPVSMRVNAVREDDAALLEPIELAPTG